MSVPPPPPTTRRLVYVLAALLTLGVTFLGGWSFFRKVEAFQPTGLTTERAAASWLVTSSEAGLTALEPGDRILLVNGQGPQEVDDLHRALRRQEESELLVMRGEELVPVGYDRPPVAVDWAYLVLALIGILYLGIGLYTVLRDSRRPGLLFYSWCLASATLYLFTTSPPFDLVDRWLFLGDQLARILLAPLTLHLFLSLPSPAIMGARLRRAVPFLYLPAAFLLVLQADLAFFDGALVFGPPTAAALTALDRIEVVHLVAAALLAAGVLIARLRRHQEWEQRRQLQWVAVGLAAGYLPFVGLYAVPMVLGMPRPELLQVLAVAPLALVPLTFAYAILRYRLWDLEVLVRSAAAYTLTILLGVVGFTLANLVIARALPPDLALRQTLAFVAGLVIAVSLVPTKRKISDVLERLHYRDQFRRRRSLSHLGRELLHERDLDRLTESLLGEIEQALGLERANLYLAQDDRLEPMRPEAGHTGGFSLDSFEPDFWEQDFVRLRGAVLPADRLTAGQRLYAAGHRYAFPLEVRGSRLGILAVGHREGSVPLSSDDLELISDLLRQCALAIENAQLVEKLQRNLQDLLQLQEHNRGIIESSPAGIVVFDQRGRVCSANAAFARIVQRQEGELVGRPLSEVLPVDPLPEPGAGLLEAKFQDARGRERYVQMSTASLDEQGRQRFSILVLQDITERVAMENALKEKDRLAALGMLAAGVAHEVNTPLTGISSYAQMLLAETPEGDPRRDVLQKIERQTFRASRIVSNLLDFARTRNRSPRPLALAKVIEEALELATERFAERDIEVQWAPPEEQITVKGDDGELQQVFTNLFLNSADAMKDGRGTLQVRLDADDEWVQVEVEDDGPGIRPEHLDKIFQPFFSTKLADGGTGLGLSISYNIVRRHGGTIRVVSETGKGTCFLIELPRFVPRDEEPR